MPSSPAHPARPRLGRRILIETVNGGTTLRFDEAGKPLTATLPLQRNPWVRFTGRHHFWVGHAVRHRSGHRNTMRRFAHQFLCDFYRAGVGRRVRRAQDLDPAAGQTGLRPGPDGVRCASMALARTGQSPAAH